LLSSSQTEWKVSELLSEKPKNGYSPKSSSEGSGTRTVSISAVKDGLFAPEGNEKYADVADDVLAKFDVREDDIFVVRGNGNKNLCGRAGLASKTYADMFYPDLLIRLRFDSEKLLPQLASRIWNNPGAHRNLLCWAKSTNGIWKVNGDDIKRHRINVPPRSKQPGIIAELERFDGLYQKAIETLSSSKSLQKSLINQVF
jgi:type I restriction enzyme S subunit